MYPPIFSQPVYSIPVLGHSPYQFPKSKTNLAFKDLGTKPSFPQGFPHYRVEATPSILFTHAYDLPLSDGTGHCPWYTGPYLCTGLTTVTSLRQLQVRQVLPVSETLRACMQWWAAWEMNGKKKTKGFSLELFHVMLPLCLGKHI